MRRILPENAILYSLILTAMPALAGNPLTVPCYPEAAYIGEPATFVVETAPGAEVTLDINGRTLGQARAGGDGAAEITVSINESGLLRAGDGYTSRVFRVVQPADSVAMVEKGGFLFNEDMPVILLAEHKFRPKHDRRWEPVKILSSVVRDVRPAAASALILGQDELLSPVLSNLNSVAGAPTGFFRHATGRDKFGEVNGFICSPGAITTADVAVVAASLRDLERGADEAEHRMKLEWLVRSLRTRGFAGVFVVLPSMEELEKERYPDLAADIAGIAAGNGAVAVSAGPAAAPDAATWLKAVLAELERHVKLR